MTIKRKISVLLLLAMLLAALSPAVALAADEGCGCATVLEGAEKNKQVANLLKSEAFKAKKKELQQAGYDWQGVSGAVVERNNATGEILIAIPLHNPSGQTVYLISVYGMFFVFPQP